MDKPTVPIRETTDILEALLNFVRGIEGCKDCTLEYLNEKVPSLCIKRVGSAYKTKQNIIGGYEAELPFIMYYKASVRDTRNRLNISGPMDMLADIFEKETRLRFPNLTLPNGVMPTKLEMVESPEDSSGIENNTAIFMAVYKLHYRKK